MSNFKIALIPILVIIITFSLLGFFQILDLESQLIGGGHMLNPHFIETPFFENDFSKSRTIFLLGSSRVASSNVTQVNDLISNKNISIYNLATSGDTPSKRIDQLNDIISSNPEIVFYGISYRDFKFPYNYNISYIPTSEQINSCFLEEYFISNPELLMRYFLKSIGSKDLGILSKTYMKNTPFYDYKPVLIPNDSKFIQNDSVKTWVKHCNMHENISSINTIISEFQSNNIKVVIFTTPLHELYLKSISDSQKEQFDKMLSNLSVKYNVEIYKFEEKYSELNIWQSPDHISYHKSITKYNEDIASMIIKESEL